MALDKSFTRRMRYMGQPGFDNMYSNQTIDSDLPGTEEPEQNGNIFEQVLNASPTKKKLGSPYEFSTPDWDATPTPKPTMNVPANFQPPPWTAKVPYQGKGKAPTPTPTATPAPKQNKTPAAPVAAKPSQPSKPQNKTQGKAPNKPVSKAPATQKPTALPIPGAPGAKPAQPAKTPGKAATPTNLPISGAPKIQTQKLPSQAPGQSMYVEVPDESTTTESGTKTSTVAPAFQGKSESVAENIMADREREKAREAGFDESLPDYATDEQRARLLGERTVEHNKNIADSLMNYTSKMDQNQEIDFWNKVIGGIGRALSGVTGLATGLDVAGKYKEPDLTTAEELNRTTQPQYAAQKEALNETFEKDTDFFSAVEKIKQGYQLNIKEQTALLRALQSNPALTKTDVTSGTKQTEGTRGQIVTAPQERAAAKNGADKPKKVTRLKTDKYSPYVADVAKQVNNMEKMIPDNPKNADDFTQPLYTLLKSYSGKGIGVPQYESIKAEYEGKIAKGLLPAQAAKEILNDFKDTLMVTPGKVPYTEMQRRAAIYGLPYHLIEVVSGPDSADIPGYGPKK